jgi:nitroreductase
MNILAALMTARFGSSTTVASDTSVNATIATLLQHRTHRAFTDQAVAAEVLQQLLAATLSAPSKSDLQQVSLIHVRAPDRIFGVGVKTDKVSFYSDPKYPLRPQISPDELPAGQTFDPAIHGHRSRQLGDAPLITLFLRA